MQTKTILVTGGAGFLGSHLCDRLIASDCRVICVDSLITGRMENINHLLGHDRFKFIKHDVIEPLEVTEEISEIYNLACPASPAKYELDPVHTFKTCIYGAINLLDFALLHDARILQASTSEVYGDPSVSPQKEDYLGNVNTVGPRSCYDEGKRGAETIFHDYHEEYGLDIKIARIFNTYGPRMSLDDGRVVSNFIVQALRGDDLSVYGTGEQTRSFCYVDDLISGLVLLMASAPSLNKPVNMGNPSEFTICELAGLVLNKTGSRAKLAFSELTQDDPKRRKPDISMAEAALHWKPLVPLSDGLDNTIQDIARQLQHENSMAAKVS